LYFGNKGEVKPFSNTLMPNNESSIIKAPRREHSRKPDEFYALVSKLCPSMSKLEMFARQSRAGWDCWGDEVGMFSEQSQSISSDNTLIT
jgi:N6-adenosine-specific RNA methylase IME4